MNFTKQTLLYLAATAILGLFLCADARGDAGDLYQVSSANGAIFRYSPGNGAAKTFAVGLIKNTADHLTFNKAGELFIDEGTGTSARILKFSTTGGNTLAAGTVFAAGIEANGMVCDDAGNLYVSDALTQSIIKITPTGVRTTFASGLDVVDLSFDLSGNLVALDYGGGINGQAKTYRIAPDGTKTFSSGLDRQKCSAADQAGNTYVGTSDGVIRQGFHTYDAASGFDFGGSVLYANGLGNIEGMACDPAGNLFVSTSAGIFRFDKQTGAKTTFCLFGGKGLAFEPPRALSLNISTRLQVQTGDNALIAGFIVTGNAAKKVLIRGIGPSLSAAGIFGALQDPIIELRNSSGAFVNGNDNWKSSLQAAIEATGAAPTDPRESAFLITLGPGSWTVALRGVGNTTGVGVVEVYDLDTAANSKLANISSRGVVQAGENVMIGGFIIGSGNGAARLAIRAIGPSLAAAGISNPLADPTLTLRDGNGALVSFNDNWGDTNATAIHDAHIAPSNLSESAMIVTVPPGNYTAVVAGKNGGAGVGLVEVYNLQ
jgi:sugar lactone lactonase YvrE